MLTLLRVGAEVHSISIHLMEFLVGGPDLVSHSQCPTRSNAPSKRHNNKAL
jgi:hypothetical protein